MSSGASPEKKSDGAGAAEGARPQQPQGQQLKLDDTHLVACYANFCRVTGTPEELILDFGLNANPIGAPVETLTINQRIIVNFYTAKRMLAALSMALQRHEAAFGVLETDVQKRVLPSAMRSQTT
jgi:hypothetical protein